MKGYVSLEKYNTYRIKSFAKNVYFPKSEQEILDIVNNNSKVIFLGNGSNIILSKEIYEDEIAFIIFSDNYSNLEINDNYIKAESGALLKDIAIKAVENGLSGIETFYDVPASVGGALIMNAGAYGDEIYHIVKSVKVLNLKTKKIMNYHINEIDYGYRYSMFKNDKNICILSCTFEFIKKNKLDIKNKMNFIYSKRLSNLPQSPSAGSVFKRPQANMPVGIMIQDLGLKGTIIGGAEISLKHGGIIINKNDATGQDIIDLINLIKLKVLENYNIILHQEQIII